MNTTIQKRYIGLDVMRIIGLAFVILAHCTIPDGLFEFREFDVTMLVFVSGASFALSESRREETWLAYIIRRFQKLIIPVWLFLTFYFLFFSLVFHQTFTMDIVLKSYLLQSGIGFVWIFRALFIVSILNPVYRKIIDLIGSNRSLVLFSILLITNELIAGMSENLPGLWGVLINDYLLYALSFGVISAIGMVWRTLDQQNKIWIAIVFLVIFLSFSITTKQTGLYEYKYPPRLYYLSYGMLASMVFDGIVNKLVFPKKIQAGIIWISSNSMTIYLWHIFAIELGIFLVPYSYSSNWLLYYLYVLVIAVICTLLQQKTNRLLRRMRGKL